MFKIDSPIFLQNINMLARQLFLLFKKSTTFWDNPRISILLIEILNAVLFWKMCTFCVVLISFYNKMTIKPQNDAIYNRNNCTIFSSPEP